MQNPIQSQKVSTTPTTSPPPTPPKPILRRSTNDPHETTIGEHYDNHLEDITNMIECWEESENNIEHDIQTFGLQFVLESFGLAITRK